MDIEEMMIDFVLKNMKMQLLQERKRNMNILIR